MSSQRWLRALCWQPLEATTMKIFLGRTTISRTIFAAVIGLFMTLNSFVTDVGRMQSTTFLRDRRHAAFAEASGAFSHS